jgi:hypothetical protein
VVEADESVRLLIDAWKLMIAAGQQSMGVRRTTLHATDMGRPIYQAMGYAPSARFKVLVRTDAH